jgi:hypothetical protein
LRNGYLVGGCDRQAKVPAAHDELGAVVPGHEASDLGVVGRVDSGVQKQRGQQLTVLGTDQGEGEPAAVARWIKPAAAQSRRDSAADAVVAVGAALAQQSGSVERGDLVRFGQAGQLGEATIRPASERDRRPGANFSQQGSS